MPPPVVVSKEVVESSSSSSDEIEVESVDRSISPPTQVLVGTGTKRRKRGTAGVLSSKNQSNDTNSRSIVGGSILENLFRLSEGKELGLESRGLDLEKAPLDAKVGSLSTSLLGRSKGVYNGTVRPCSGHVFPENCLFCGQGGNLLLCDYPGCRRCYHQVPSPNDSFKQFPNAECICFSSIRLVYQSGSPYLCPTRILPPVEARWMNLAYILTSRGYVHPIFVSVVSH